MKTALSIRPDMIKYAFSVFFSFIPFTGIVLAQPHGDNKAEEVVEEARAFFKEKIRYKLGGEGERRNGRKYYDCSSYTRAVFKNVGINLPRTSSQQYNYHRGTRLKGTHEIPNLQIGDLVFFGRTSSSGYNHIGIVVENNRGKVRFIHCSSNKNGLGYDYIEGSFLNRYKGARRMFRTQNPRNNTLLSETKDPRYYYVPGKNKYKGNSGSKSEVVPGKYPEGSAKWLDDDDVEDLLPCEAKLMKNEIYARNGYKFYRNPCVVEIFEGEEYNWYRDTAPRSEKGALRSMSPKERQNVELLIQQEQGCECY